MRFIGNVEKDAQVRAVASGALSTGDTVVVNSDGTVSVVEETSVSQAVGSNTVFETGTTSHISIGFDSGSNKVVLAYQDQGNSNYGTAIVGTVSGTSISFGSAVVFNSGNTEETTVAYDTSAGKVVIAYRDRGNSFYGTAVVGTVSGTSISFGSEVVFSSENSQKCSAAYDSGAQKVVVCYQNSSNNGVAKVGTVSGTSISFGSAATFNAASTDRPHAVYESGSGKIVVTFTDVGNSSYATAIVGTVSGTSISFGSETVINSAASYFVSSAYDSGSNKIVTVYADAGNNEYGTAIVGTVSGTSISYGSPTVFKSSIIPKPSASYDSAADKTVIGYPIQSSQGANISVGTVSGNAISFTSSTQVDTGDISFSATVYDSSSEKVVYAYQDQFNSSRGTAVVFQPAYTSSNLTTENFLGFAAHTYADTQNAVINSTCTVDRNQSGLTAGQKYYVQTDGTLGTTAADPSVEAGTAISSTEIIVKG